MTSQRETAPVQRTKGSFVSRLYPTFLIVLLLNVMSSYAVPCTVDYSGQNAPFCGATFNSYNTAASACASASSNCSALNFTMTDCTGVHVLVCTY